MMPLSCAHTLVLSTRRGRSLQHLLMSQLCWAGRAGTSAHVAAVSPSAPASPQQEITSAK